MKLHFFSNFRALWCYVLVICNDILIFKLFFFLRINGLMTIRNAIIICETDNNCAGFTYKGPIWDLDEIYDVYFFRWVHIFVLKFVSFVDWKFSQIFCWHLEKFKYLSADRFIPIMKFFLIYLFYISNIDGGYQWLRQIAKYPLIKSA